MESKKPTATLTDVKNKTGNVFAAADKHGKVIITSYNKPKYVIAKYSVYHELELKANQAGDPVETKAVIQEESVPVHQPTEAVITEDLANQTFGSKPNAEANEINVSTGTQEITASTQPSVKHPEIEVPDEKKNESVAVSQLPTAPVVSESPQIQPVTVKPAEPSFIEKLANTFGGDHRSEPKQPQPEPVQESQKVETAPAPQPVNNFAHIEWWDRSSQVEKKWLQHIQNLL